MKRTQKLGFKIGALFTVFLVVILLLCGITTYYGQMSIYRAQCENDIRSVGEYLASLMTAEGEDFIIYQNYFLNHYAEVDIPVDADEYLTAQDAYNDLFSRTYPGRTLGIDIEFDELSDDVKHAYLVYTQLYWILTFEQAREDFGLPYSYYLVVDTEKENVIYMIDGERSSRAGHLEFIEKYPEYKPYHHEQGSEAEFMYLHDEYHNDASEYAILWKTWKTGERQPGYQVFRNKWGNTYAYYTPLVINGQKLGLVATEVEIAAVNNEILKDTLRQLAVIAVIMTAGVIALVFIINRRYVRKIVELEAQVKDYTLTKDPAVGDEIERNIRGRDEITSLAEGVVSMIREIEHHINNLTRTYQELDEAYSDAERMRTLAVIDGLTGIRNMSAYELEVNNLNRTLSEKPVDFAIAMIDMNDLKRINDTYGHGNGNKAIKKLSDIICQVFKHSMVFRIGGDEFAVILENDDYANRNAAVGKFKYRLETLQRDPSLPPWEKISAAIGLAAFDPSLDTQVESVFKRADAAMYEDKKAMKASRK